MPGRFFLGVGTGENLNEHILGDRWPPTRPSPRDARGGGRRHAPALAGRPHDPPGRHYTVEDARLYTLPDEPTEVMVAAGGTEGAELAGRIGDGLVGTAPERELLEAFDEPAGRGKPRYGQLTVCWADDGAAGAEDGVRDLAERRPPGASSARSCRSRPTSRPAAEHGDRGGRRRRPSSAVPTPSDTPRRSTTFAEAGYDHVYVHQVGPDQDGLLPLLPSASSSRGMRRPLRSPERPSGLGQRALELARRPAPGEVLEVGPVGDLHHEPLHARVLTLRSTGERG